MDLTSLFFINLFDISPHQNVHQTTQNFFYYAILLSALTQSITGTICYNTAIENPVVFGN